MWHRFGVRRNENATGTDYSVGDYCIWDYRGEFTCVVSAVEGRGWSIHAGEIVVNLLKRYGFNSFDIEDIKKYEEILRHYEFSYDSDCNEYHIKEIDYSGPMLNFGLNLTDQDLKNIESLGVF